MPLIWVLFIYKIVSMVYSFRACRAGPVGHGCVHGVVLPAGFGALAFADVSDIEVGAVGIEDG